MDLGRESSALEFVEDNEGVADPSGKLDNADETKVGTNGSYAHEKRDNGIVNTEAGVGSPAVMIGKSSPSSPTLSPSPGAGGATKGKGLKKWRRIKRDVIKEGGSNVDEFLKRGLSNWGANLSKPMQFSGGSKENKDGSLLSSNALLRSLENGVDLFAAMGDSRIGPGVGNVTDSENSEDRSSKSSTAASAPKMTGYALENTRMMRNLSGNNLGNRVRLGQTGKGQSGTSKKLRGEVVKIEKENSHSSMESDSRSSNFVFTHGIDSVTSNGRQSGRKQNYDGENSDEVQGSERQPREDLQVGSSGKNGVAYEGDYQEELAADSSWGMKEGKNENSGPSRDPLLDSISSLESAKEALEKEIQKFMEIGKEDSTPDDSSKGISFEQLQFSDLGNQSFDSLELEVNNLKQTNEVLGIKLDDAEALLKVKEAQIRELQECTSCHTPARIETEFSKKVHQENDRDLEIELDDLFKQKIEAEVEYLAISRTVQNLRVNFEDQISILKKQKAEQTQMLNKVGELESRAAKLTAEGEKLKNYCEDIVSTDETVELKTSICKYTTCFVIQSMLLLTIFILLFGQLLPSYSEVVPT